MLTSATNNPLVWCRCGKASSPTPSQSARLQLCHSRVGKQRPGELKAAEPANGLHGVNLRLGGGVPALVVLNMPVVAVVLAVADAPAW